MSMFELEIDRTAPRRPKVIGVGGAGNNAAQSHDRCGPRGRGLHRHEHGMQALEALAPTRIQIGINATRSRRGWRSSAGRRSGEEDEQGDQRRDR